MDDPTMHRTLAQRQADELAASLDAAADELDRNGPVPPAEVRRALLELFAELDEDGAAE